MAESAALAVLENLVHMDRRDFPRNYVVVAAVIPDRVQVLSDQNLRTQFGDLSSKELGDKWINSSASAVLYVASTIVRSEHNYLLNPKHPDFQEIILELPVPFDFDERLFDLRL